jgi:uncharacterized protein YxeA
MREGLNMKSIASAIIIGTIFLGLTGCGVQHDSPDATAKIVKEDVQNEVKILEVGTNLKETEKEGANYTYFLQEEAKGGLDSGSKHTFNIDLKEGQYLKIQTDTKYPITVMLKDNSTEEYVYNDTAIPKENVILTDAINKDGKYELMVDFNEIEVFNFDVFIMNE